VSIPAAGIGPSRILGGDANTIFFLAIDGNGLEVRKASPGGAAALVEDFIPGAAGIDLELSFTPFAAGVFLMPTSLQVGKEPHLITYAAIPYVGFGATGYRVSDTGAIEITVERIGAATGAASVRWTTENGTALAGQDFGNVGSTTQRTGTLSWASGDLTPRKITVANDTRANIPLIAGATHDPDEAFTVRLSAPTGGIALDGSATTSVTIVDATPGVEFAAAAITVNEAGGNATLRVVRSGALDTPATVTWQTTAVTADAGTDFGDATTPLPQGTLTFAAGEFEKTIAIGRTAVAAPYIPITQNDGLELDETFTVKLTSNTAGVVVGANGTATVTIRSGESGVSLTRGPVFVTEGPSAVAHVRVDRLGNTGAPISVTYQSFDMNALEGVDYVAVSGTLSWTASDLQPKFIDVPIIDNSISNLDRSFSIVLGGAGPFHIQGVAVSILDDEVGAFFAFSDEFVSEASGSVTLTVSRTGAATNAASVRWTTSDGTAKAGQDFGVRNSAVQRTGIVSWPAGDATDKTFTIPILQDASSEGPETFTVSLSMPAGGLVLGAPSVATVTIEDDEPPLESSVAFVEPKVLVAENQGNATLVVRRAPLGGGFSLPLTVSFTLAEGNAMEGSDYVMRSGVLNWAAGDAADKAIVIPIANNNVVEPHESFAVSLSTTSPGARIDGALATVVIVDDDEAFPKFGSVPDGWVIPAGAAKGWRASNDAGAFEGFFSLRSEQVDDGEAAQVEVTRVFAAGSITFRAKVSSELNFDRLRFFVDGVEMGSWSGTANTGWQAFTVPINAGSHVVRWSYEKDGSGSVGSDAAWIDAVVLP